MAALFVVPIATADRVVSVGYRTPAALHGLRVAFRIDALRTAEVRVRDARAERALRSRPGIRFVHRTVTRTQADAPAIPFTSGLAVPEWQWNAAHADLVPAWVQQAAHSIKIAVVDTGADLLTPSIASKSPATWNVATGTSAVHDAVGHGTFVASLAAGATTASGMSGFGGDAQLMIVQANRGGTGFSDLDEAQAITWAVQNGANIINLSLGGTQTSPTERAAIDYATQHGVLLVAAAGNSAQQGNPTVYPAALLGESGLVVGASTPTGSRAPFSTTGSYVDLLAPGVDVLGALASGVAPGYFTPVATPGASGAYALGSGTSYAAPEVSGAAALVWAANPKLDAAGVAATLEATAANHGSRTPDLAYGAVDIAAAVQLAAAGTTPTFTQPVLTVAPKARAQRAKVHAASKKTKARRARP